MHFLVSFTAGIVLHDAQGTRWSYILYTRWSFLGNSFIFPISPPRACLLYTTISTFTYLWYFTIICKQTNKVIINRIVYYCFVVYLPTYLFIYFLSFPTQVLPSWKTTISGSISLKFRTNEPHGLLLFNAGGSPGKVSTT